MIRALIGDITQAGEEMLKVSKCGTEIHGPETASCHSAGDFPGRIDPGVSCRLDLMILWKDISGPSV